MEKRERCIHFYSVCTVAIVVLPFCTIPVPMSIFAFLISFEELPPPLPQIMQLW